MTERYVQFVEPATANDPTPVFTTVSETEIRNEYFPIWREKSGVDDFEQCFQDFKIVHWAWELEG